MIQVVLPANLRTLAGVGTTVELELTGPATQRAVIDMLETRYPALKGTIRDTATQRRRPMLRFYACQEDLSDAEPDEPLPHDVVTGREPYLIVGAMAGG